MSTRASPDNERRPAGSALEWIAAAIGLALTLGIVAVIGGEALRAPDDAPPVIEVIVQQSVRTQAGYVVQLEVQNHAEATAAAVQIEGTLASATSHAEISRATIDYVPGRSTRRAGLFFSADPSSGQLSVRATGYEEP